MAAPLLLAALLLLVPLDAFGHGVLRRSVPAEDARLNEAPRELRLEFNEAIDLEFTRLALIGPSGEAVRLERLSHAGDSAHVVLAGIARLVRAGEYTVQWQITGADGHPVRGDFTFTVVPGAAGLVAEPAPVVTGDSPVEPGAAAASATLTRFDAESPLYAAVRWLTFTALVVLVGAAGFVFLLLPRVRIEDRKPVVDTIGLGRSRAASAGLVAAGVLLVAVVLRLLAQSVALHDPERAFALERIWAMLTRTTWGWGWLIQAAATLVAVAGLIVARRGKQAGWWMAGLAILVLAVTPGLSGHAAATSAIAVAADAVHVLAAGGWLGTLLLLLVVGLPTLARDAPSRTAAAAGLLRAFSPLALLFAAILTLTGVYAAWLHLPDVGSVWTSAYGRTLLFKLGALSLVAGAGAYNWQRVKPALERGGDVKPLTRSAGAELAVGVVVLAITAVLVATPPPDPDRERTAGVVAESPNTATADGSPGRP